MDNDLWDFTKYGARQSSPFTIPHDSCYIAGRTSPSKRICCVACHKRGHRLSVSCWNHVAPRRRDFARNWPREGWIIGRISRVRVHSFAMYTFANTTVKLFIDFCCLDPAIIPRRAVVDSHLAIACHINILLYLDFNASFDISRDLSKPTASYAILSRTSSDGDNEDNMAQKTNCLSISSRLTRNVHPNMMLTSLACQGIGPDVTCIELLVLGWGGRSRPHHFAQKH